MPIRFRRRRLLFFVIFVVIYLINYYLYSGEKNDVKRSSLGEDGTGVELSLEERNNPKFQQLYEEYGFNAFVSDRISLDRSVKDVRHPK